MPAITKLTCTFAASRSQNYQSVRVENSAEFTLSEGEKPTDALNVMQARLQAVTNAQADAALIELLSGGQSSG